MTYKQLWIKCGCDIVELSASTGDGKEKLYDLLNDKFFSGELEYNDQLYITNARHKEELMKTRESLLKVRESIDMGMEEDFFSIDLMDAYEHLGLIIGETNRDDLADKIFEEFCMGK
jgi:tRNA modification GTPase